jgi:hypothetical protein
MVIRLTPEELAARSRRNVWIGLALAAFVVLLFTTTFLRMQANQKAEQAKTAALAAATSAGPMHPEKTYNSTLAR